MVGIYDVEPSMLIEKAAEDLKKVKEVEPPIWSNFVKTGHFKDRPPARADWWYVRAAAILRSIYRLGPIGTQKLRTKYGGKKNRGFKTEHSYQASGAIIRKILQQLEKAGLIAKAEKGDHKGRILTPKGVSFLNAAAKAVSKTEKPKKKLAEKPVHEKSASSDKPAHEKPKETHEKPVHEKPKDAHHAQKQEKPAQSEKPVQDKPKESHQVKPAHQEKQKEEHHKQEKTEPKDEADEE